MKVSSSQSLTSRLKENFAGKLSNKILASWKTSAQIVEPLYGIGILHSPFAAPFDFGFLSPFELALFGLPFVPKTRITSMLSALISCNLLKEISY